MYLCQSKRKEKLSFSLALALKPIPNFIFYGHLALPFYLPFQFLIKHFFSTLSDGFSCHVRSNQWSYAIIIEIVYHFQQSQLILSFSSSALCAVCCVWPITLCYCVHECGPRDMTKETLFFCWRWVLRNGNKEKWNYMLDFNEVPHEVVLMRHFTWCFDL